MKTRLTEISKEKRFLGLLLGISLAVRALIFSGYLGKEWRFWQVDSSGSHHVGVALAQGNGFTQADGKPKFLRLPGSPLFIAASYSLLGPSVQKMLWAQIVQASLIPLLIFILTIFLFPGHVLLARMTGLYSSLHLGLVLYSGFVMSESLFLFFFLLFLCFLIPWLHPFPCIKKKQHGNLFIAGFMLGCASIIRPVGLYLVLLSSALIIASRGS